MLRIALIACSKSKLAHAAPARDLYTGRVFRAAYAYAKATCDETLILSAKHGLIEPTKVIEPYDVSLSEMTSAERRAWVELVRDQFDQHGIRFVAYPTTLVLLAGALYRAPFPLGYGVDFQHVEYSAPLARIRGSGRQYAWLVANTPSLETSSGVNSGRDVGTRLQAASRKSALVTSPSLKVDRSQTGLLSAVVHVDVPRVTTTRGDVRVGASSAVHQYQRSDAVDVPRRPGAAGSANGRRLPPRSARSEASVGVPRPGVEAPRDGERPSRPHSPSPATSHKPAVSAGRRIEGAELPRGAILTASRSRNGNRRTGGLRGPPLFD